MPLAPLGPRCSTCPVNLPACFGQRVPAFCAGDDDSGDPTVGLTDKSGRHVELSKSLSSIYFGWPAPQAGGTVSGTPATISASGSVAMSPMAVFALADAFVPTYDVTGAVTMGNMHITASITYSTDVSGGG